LTRVAITGASRGIGRAAVQVFAERGTDLVLVGRPSAARDESRRLGRDLGVDVQCVDADLALAPDVERAGRELAALAPDVLVNNAGVIERASIEETSTASWERQLGVNLTAPFLLTRGLLPSFRARGRGRFVHVGSISSTLGSPRAAAYCAAKWGLIGFMKSLAEEISDSGLMTVAVLPGSVDTEMLAGSGFVPRMKPLDVARTIVHYALDASLAHNGAVVEMFGT